MSENNIKEEREEILSITIELPQYIVKHIDELASLTNKPKERVIQEFICQELEYIGSPDDDTLQAILKPFAESIQKDVQNWRENL